MQPSNRPSRSCVVVVVVMLATPGLRAQGGVGAQPTEGEWSAQAAVPQSPGSTPGDSVWDGILLGAVAGFAGGAGLGAGWVHASGRYEAKPPGYKGEFVTGTGVMGAAIGALIGWRLDAARGQALPGQERASWIERHPIVFGALVGFISGCAMAASRVGGSTDTFVNALDEWACPVVGGATGGAGALLGWSVARWK